MNETILTTKDTEKGLENIELTSNKCPFGYDKLKSEKEETKINKEAFEKEDKSKGTAKKEDNLSDEEEVNGGCPVMNKVKKDPVNKHYDRSYEIPRFGPFDFMFHMRGLLEIPEYLEKTKKLRSYPRHMRYTLFTQHDEKLQKVHEKEFPMVFFIYDDIKEKGNRLFRRKKFREAIEHYNYAYGLLKWIQFKDKKRQEEFIKKPSLEPILDDDIEEKHVYLDDVKVEEDSYKACVVYLLMNLSCAYMELRHFSEAIDCLNEAIEIAGDRIPDLYFRRSQARSCNKYSNEEELAKALEDINKAIEIAEIRESEKKEGYPHPNPTYVPGTIKTYTEHKENVLKIVEKKVQDQVDKTKKILSKAKRAHDRIKERNLKVEDCIYTKSKDATTQYKIIKE